MTSEQLDVLANQIAELSLRIDVVKQQMLIERLTAAYRRTRTDPQEPPADQRRFVRRTNTASGMVQIEAQLSPEQANVVWEALSAALDRRPDDSAESQTSAEAGTSAETQQKEFDPSERADALVSVAQGYLDQTPRTLGSGYELVVMTTKEQLEHGHAGVGGYLRYGTPVPLHLARMLACDCSRVDVDGGSNPFRHAVTISSKSKIGSPRPRQTSSTLISHCGMARRWTSTSPSSGSAIAPSLSSQRRCPDQRPNGIVSIGRGSGAGSGSSGGAMTSGATSTGCGQPCGQRAY
jgi:hypothetical protein